MAKEKSEDDTVRVNVRADRKTRSEWKDFADEHGGTKNLRHLVHRGVETYITRNENGGGEMAALEGSALGDDQLDDITERLDELTAMVDSEVVTQLSELDHRLSELESEVTKVSPDEPQVDSKDVVTALPPAKPQSSKWEKAQKLNPTDPRDSSTNIAWSGTIASVATVLGCTTDRARELLSLVDDTGIVESAVVDGSLSYWSPEKSGAETPGESGQSLEDRR